MEVSCFLREYIYIPLGGNRTGIARLYTNLLITMAVSGLWHGAAWHFVLWGTLQGVGMILNHAWRLVWRPIHSWWAHTRARLGAVFSLGVLLGVDRAPAVAVAPPAYPG